MPARLVQQMNDARMTITYHPTRQKLIDAFLQMAEDDHFGKIKVGDLLKKAGISKGSLYHHFADFDDLLAEAMAYAFSVGVNRSIQLLDGTLEKINSREDLQLLFRRLTLDTLTPEGKRQRVMRAKVMGASVQYPKLDAVVRAAQTQLTRKFEEMFLLAGRKGFLKPGLNLHLCAVFIQAYTFGKIIDDMSGEAVDPDDWADWIVSILTYKILI
jgi:AcrR family transcriptional regulator